MKPDTPRYEYARDGTLNGAAIAFLDIWNRSELPTPPSGYRFLDFIGGSKELRCFLVPYDMARSVFIRVNGDLLDPVLSPIYHHGGIVVSQDGSYALPGFYILSFERHYRSFDEIDPETHARAAGVLRAVRIAMREALGIPFIHMHYEEKPDESCNVHYWLMPVCVDKGEYPPIIYDLNLRVYLSRFKLLYNRNAILECNAKMRAVLAEFVLTGKLAKC